MPARLIMLEPAAERDVKSTTRHIKSVTRQKTNLARRHLNQMPTARSQCCDLCTEDQLFTRDCFTPCSTCNYRICLSVTLFTFQHTKVESPDGIYMVVPDRDMLYDMTCFPHPPLSLGHLGLLTSVLIADNTKNQYSSFFQNSRSCHFCLTSNGNKLEIVEYGFRFVKGLLN